MSWKIVIELTSGLFKLGTAWSFCMVLYLFIWCCFLFFSQKSFYLLLIAVVFCKYDFYSFVRVSEIVLERFGHLATRRFLGRFLGCLRLIQLENNNAYM